MAIINIDAITVPNKPFMSYGLDKAGNLAFVYGHDTQRGAEMKTSRIGNGNDKYWKPADLKQWGWMEVTPAMFKHGLRVWS